MKFGIVKPRTREGYTVECETLRDAELVAELDPGAVDHGVVADGIGIVVYEFGLFVPPVDQSYFAIGGRLYAGNAVLYGFHEDGETADLVRLPQISMLSDYRAVERAIAERRIVRPEMSVNGKVMWQWPSAAPAGMKR